MFEALNHEGALDPGMQGHNAINHTARPRLWSRSVSQMAFNLGRLFSPQSQTEDACGERGRERTAQSMAEISLPAYTPDENFFPSKHQGSLAMCLQELWRSCSLGWGVHWSHPDSRVVQVWAPTPRNSKMIIGRNMTGGLCAVHLKCEACPWRI